MQRSHVKIDIILFVAYHMANKILARS